MSKRWASIRPYLAAISLKTIANSSKYNIVAVGIAITFVTMLTTLSHCISSLPQESPYTRRYQEIVVRHQPSISECYNKLEAAERIMSYYLYRAILPANRILANQHHRHAREIVDLFTQFYRYKDRIIPHLGTEFIKQVETYLVYLASNHGHYFKRLNTKNKRTPPSLNLTLLTPATIKKALQLAPTTLNEESLDNIISALFIPEYEQTLMKPGTIDASATNFHDLLFNDLDFEVIPAVNKKVHAYYDINDQGEPIVRYAHIGGHYSDELSVSTHWLEKAYVHAQSYPHLFDEHFSQSLEHLIAFFKTGDEDEFKKHFIHWINTDSVIDYSLGFIETLDDPMATTGSMQGEVTIKHQNQEKLTQLNAVLPDIEEALPFPQAYKRTNTSLSRTASINTQLYATGALGPLQITLAYNLPNYRDIKAEHGTKVILYPTEPSLEAHLNPNLWRQFYFSFEQIGWLEEHDPYNTLSTEITELLHCLHETIGHASGKLATHTFAENDKLNIGSISYEKGETIPVTDENLPLLITQYRSALEELRAEVIALYVATHHLDELSSCGFLKEWIDIHGTERIIQWILHTMTYRGLKRLARQAPVYLEKNSDPFPLQMLDPDLHPHPTQQASLAIETVDHNELAYMEEAQCNSIKGVYAQANAVITNFLIKKGAATLRRENITIDGKTHPVATITIIDSQKGLRATKELMQQVQCITSTGDGQQAEALFNQYGRTLGTPDITAIMQQNKKTLIGKAQVFANIYPALTPIIDLKKNEIIEVEARWPKDIFQQILDEEQRTLSKEF